MAIFPKGGTKEKGYAMLPSKNEMIDGSWAHPLGVEISKNSGVYHKLDKWFGWIATNSEIKSRPEKGEPRAPPARGGRYSDGLFYNVEGMTGRDFQAYPTILGFKKMVRDAKEKYSMEFKDADWMKEKYNSPGFEDNGFIHVSDGLSYEKLVDVLAHEMAAKEVRKKTGRNHDAVEGQIKTHARNIVGRYIDGAMDMYKAA